MHSKLRSRLFVLVAALSFCAAGLRAQHVVHAVTGAVDATAKTIAVKTTDGTEEVFKYTAKTGVHGATDTKDAAKTGAVDTYGGQGRNTRGCALRWEWR
jgi:hypothetical protein